MKSLIVLSLFLFLFYSCSHQRSIKSNIYKKYFYQVDCKIYDWEGHLVERFPGGRCSFLKNGSFVSASAWSLDFFDESKALVWSYPKYFHHMTSVGELEDKVLGISTTEEKLDGEYYRVDVLVIFDIKGNIIAQKKLNKSFFDKWKIKPKVSSTDWVSGMPWYAEKKIKVKKQWSHVNSFYEIPKQVNGGDRVFRKGNFIINMKGVGVLIFDSKLEELLYFHSFESSKNHFVHDAQVTKYGTILYFNNRAKNSDCESINAYSAVEEQYPSKQAYVEKRVKKKIIEDKIKYRFPPAPNPLFISEFAGGVQLLSDKYILTSTVTQGPYIIDRDTSSIVYSNVRFIVEEGDIFQVKALKQKDYDWLR